MTHLILRINNSITDSSFVAAPGNFIDVDPVNDSFIFSAGSGAVADGQPLPSATDLNRAATQLSAIADVIVSKYLLSDASAALLKEIKLAGNQNKQFVFCASFDGATASEPILEAWDDTNLNSIALACLGAGVAANSWYKAVRTTSGLPGSNWAGIHLAGSASGNHILLNGGVGALGAAVDLYFNFKIVIPAGTAIAALYQPVLLITYTTN